jgi:acyl dehydratase
MKKKLTVGDTLFTLEKPPINQEQLKTYSEASLDTNPIHLSEEIAKKAGLPGVIAHGMITMAFMGEYLCKVIETFSSFPNNTSQNRIEEFSCRFRSMTFIGDIIVISATVDAFEDKSISLSLTAKKKTGETTATGSAKLILSGI